MPAMHAQAALRSEVQVRIADPSVELWDAHFADPGPARTRALAVLAEPERQDERTLAWAELTEAFYRLYFDGGPAQAIALLDRAGERLLKLADRRGTLLVDAGRAHILVFEEEPLAAREILAALLAETERELAPRDRFWILNALSASYHATDEMDEAIRCLYEALELLRTIPLSPHRVTVLSDLAAALVTVGDHGPAQDVACEAVGLLATYHNDELLLRARSNLAEAQLGSGDPAAALATVEAMLDARETADRATRNHFCGIAAEVFALHGRVADAERAAKTAAAIFAKVPGAFNEVHWRWSEACVAATRDPGEGALPALDAALVAATRARHVATLCKALAALAERHAALGRFEAAYEAQRRLAAVTSERLENRARAHYYLLRVEHELSQVRAERDRALDQRQASEAMNRELEQVNAELSRRMREIEELRARLEREAVHDPLTQLFNRRYLDSAMPGLIGAAERREAPLTLALLDLDRFKDVNDRHGHLAGDKVLLRIGTLFANSLRPSDIVSRWGGEEFCIVFPDTDTAGAATALATLAARLRVLQVDWHGEVVTGLTFSAALVSYGTHGLTLDELVAAADHTLYAAKGAGRDRVLIARS